MEMQQVRYFLAAAEDLNFTRAAARCNVAQPTMTRAIKSLEYELGGALFRRERANTHLTELGGLMLPYMRQILTQATEAKKRAQAFGKADQATLTLGLMCTVAPASFLELVRSIRINHPGIELEICDATAATLCKKLTQGELEVAILAHADPFPDNLHRIPLFREQFVIAVSTDHPLAARQTITPRDLEGENYLDRTNCEFGEVAELVFKEQGVTDCTVYRSDRDDWVLALAAAGLGYAFMPEQCAVHPQIAARPLVEPEIWREVSIVTVHGRPYSSPLGALVHEAARAFRKTMPPVMTDEALDDADDVDDKDPL